MVASKDMYFAARHESSIDNFPTISCLTAYFSKLKRNGQIHSSIFENKFRTSWYDIVEDLEGLVSEICRLKREIRVILKL